MRLLFSREHPSTCTSLPPFPVVPLLALLRLALPPAPHSQGFDPDTEPGQTSRDPVPRAARPAHGALLLRPRPPDPILQVRKRSLRKPPRVRRNHYLTAFYTQTSRVTRAAWPRVAVQAVSAINAEPCMWCTRCADCGCGALVGALYFYSRGEHRLSGEEEAVATMGSMRSAVTCTCHMLTCTYTWTYTCTHAHVLVHVHVMSMCMLYMHMSMYMVHMDMDMDIWSEPPYSQGDKATEMYIVKSGEVAAYVYVNNAVQANAAITPLLPWRQRAIGTLTIPALHRHGTDSGRQHLKTYMLPTFPNLAGARPSGQRILLWRGRLRAGPSKASTQPLRALLRVGLSSSQVLLRVNLSSGPALLN